MIKQSSPQKGGVNNQNNGSNKQIHDSTKYVFSNFTVIHVRCVIVDSQVGL